MGMYAQIVQPERTLLVLGAQHAHRVVLGQRCGLVSQVKHHQSTVRHVLQGGTVLQVARTHYTAVVAHHVLQGSTLVVLGALHVHHAVLGRSVPRDKAHVAVVLQASTRRRLVLHAQIVQPERHLTLAQANVQV